MYDRPEVPVTPESLLLDIAGTNNGYLFVPTDTEVAVARANPRLFWVSPVGGLSHNGCKVGANTTPEYHHAKAALMAEARTGRRNVWGKTDAERGLDAPEVCNDFDTAGRSS